MPKKKHSRRQKEPVSKKGGQKTSSASSNRSNQSVKQQTDSQKHKQEDKFLWHRHGDVVDAPLPSVNVWAIRKERQDSLTELQPHNESEENAMLRRALNLSRMQELEDKRKKRQELDMIQEVQSYSELGEEEAIKLAMELSLQQERADQQMQRVLHNSQVTEDENFASGYQYTTKYRKESECSTYSDSSNKSPHVETSEGVRANPVAYKPNSAQSDDSDENNDSGEEDRMHPYKANAQSCASNTAHGQNLCYKTSHKSNNSMSKSNVGALSANDDGTWDDLDDFKEHAPKQNTAFYRGNWKMSQNLKSSLPRESKMRFVNPCMDNPGPNLAYASRNTTANNSKALPSHKKSIFVNGDKRKDIGYKFDPVTSSNLNDLDDDDAEYVHQAASDTRLPTKEILNMKEFKDDEKDYTMGNHATKNVFDVGYNSEAWEDDDDDSGEESTSRVNNTPTSETDQFKPRDKASVVERVTLQVKDVQNNEMNKVSSMMSRNNVEGSLLKNSVNDNSYDHVQQLNNGQWITSPINTYATPEMPKAEYQKSECSVNSESPKGAVLNADRLSSIRSNNDRSMDVKEWIEDSQKQNFSQESRDSNGATSVPECNGNKTSRSSSISSATHLEERLQQLHMSRNVPANIEPTLPSPFPNEPETGSNSTKEAPVTNQFCNVPHGYLPATAFGMPPFFPSVPAYPVSNAGMYLSNPNSMMTDLNQLMFFNPALLQKINTLNTLMQSAQYGQPMPNIPMAPFGVPSPGIFPPNLMNPSSILPPHEFPTNFNTASGPPPSSEFFIEPPRSNVTATNAPVPEDFIGIPPPRSASRSQEIGPVRQPKQKFSSICSTFGSN